MCSSCEDMTHDNFAMDDPMVLQAREIEQGMNGERVPETAWLAYLCKSDEPILWKHYERVRAALDEAKARPNRVNLKARPTRQRLACDPVS